jgi:hypothetical protein
MPMCIAASATVILPAMRKIGSWTISLPGVFLGSSSTHSLLICGAFLAIFLLLPFCEACPCALLL